MTEKEIQEKIAKVNNEISQLEELRERLENSLPAGSRRLNEEKSGRSGRISKL